jgi:hypothetical protein
MKIINTTTRFILWSVVVGSAAFIQAAAANEQTAYDLAKEGNRYVGEQSKDQVVQIRSEKSISGLTPDMWYVVYYDPDAPLKAVEVKFGAGKKMDVKRPARLIEPIIKAQDPLPKDQLKIDSNDAVKIASKEPLLARLTLKASQLTLERRSVDDSAAVWKVRLWAAKLKNPNDNVEVGEVIVSAADGSVLKSDLKPDHVD